MADRKKEFVRLIEGAARRTSVMDAFGDAVHLMALSLWAPLAPNRAAVEADYGATRRKYADGDMDAFARALKLVISQRTKEALKRLKAEGVVLGRPKGRKTAPEKHKLHSRMNLIRELLGLGQSRNKIARICKVHRNTLARFIRDNEILLGERGRA